MKGIMEPQQTITLELKLLRGPQHRLTPMEEGAVQRFYANPSADSWPAAADVVVSVLTSIDDDRPLTLGRALLVDFPQLATSVRRESRNDQDVDFWSIVPTSDMVRTTLRRLARTDRLPPIALELDLARTANNRLTEDERVAISRLYYSPMVAHFFDAKDIVLLEEAEPDGSDLTLIGAIDSIAPNWLEGAMFDREVNGRITKSLRRAPESELVRAALIRATH